MTEIRLSPDLDIPALAATLAARRRLHVPNVFAADTAEVVADALEAETRWNTTVAAGGAFFEVPLNGKIPADPSKQAWLDEGVVDGASPVMQYVHDTRRLAPGEDGAPRDAIEKVMDFLNGDEGLAFLRTLTGDDRVDFCDGQASRYRPGHVLTGHNDTAPGRNRLYAYVLNFTRDWRADWGGALVFHGAAGHIDQGWVPAFNALNIFAVPTRHAVTQVASFAMRDRLSIVGWLRSNSPVGPQPGDEARAAY